MGSKNEYARCEVYKRWKEDKNFPRNPTAREFGVNPRTIYTWIKEFEKGEIPDLEKLTKERRSGKKDRRKPRVKIGGTLDDFRNQFDDSVVVPNAIEIGIKKHLTKGGEGLYMRDQDFREACDVSAGKWRRYADDYKHLQVKKDGVVFWGHPDIIDELRKAVNR